MFRSLRLVRMARAVFVLSGAALVLAVAAFASGASYRVGPVSDVSAACIGAGGSAEVEQAVDPALGYVYELWMGCKGIGFARSTDGGRSFDPPIYLQESPTLRTWDPSVAVASDGTVYAAFMRATATQSYPVVEASFDHGRSFKQVTALIPPDKKNWGDRDFIAVGPDGTVYVTWDYGPSAATVTFLCAANGSCGFATGQLNAVIQKSTDHGKTFGPMSYVSPGFPASGADSAPMVVEPNGRIDVLYQGFHITNTTTYAMDPAHSYFTSSTDGGATWSTPVELGPSSGTMSLAEWWIDGDIGIDGAGNLYAVWDTQGATTDTGWLSYSTDHGAHWSTPVQVPPDRLNVPHVMEVAGGGPGIAYVSFFSPADPSGYADYLRTFSVAHGFLGAPTRVSPEFGDPSLWPGDTFGISALSPDDVVLSWGSATASTNDEPEIFAAPVGVRLP